MKKYLLLFLTIIIFIPGIVFSLPSFEVYPEEGDPWPEITNVEAVVVGSTITITAEITDTSPISSATITIRDYDGAIIYNEAIFDNGYFPDDEEGDEIYTAQCFITQAGNYDIYISATDNLGNSTPEPLEVLNSFTITILPGWLYKKPITISHANVDSNLTNFPVYVEINSDTDIGGTAMSNGYDIRFTDADGNMLDYERESWSVSDGQATASFWVSVSSISSTEDTTIYIYYGKDESPDGQNATAVWDSNYKGVWHMSEATGINNNDSTINANIGTPTNGPTQSTGKISGSLNFDGSNDYVSLSQLPISGSTSFSVFSWVKTSATGARRQVFSFGSLATNQGMWFFVNSNNKIQMDLSNAGGPSSSLTVTDGNWHYVGVVNNSGTIQIYVDGLASGSSASMSPNISAGSQVMARSLTDYGDAYYFPGYLDEVRVSSTARSASWIKFEYYNMNSEDNELEVGGQEAN